MVSVVWDEVGVCSRWRLSMGNMVISSGGHGHLRPCTQLQNIMELKKNSFQKLSCFFSAIGGSRGLFGSADSPLVKRWHAESAKAPSRTSHYQHHHAIVATKKKMQENMELYRTWSKM